jgi:hypothetical protein
MSKAIISSIVALALACGPHVDEVATEADPILCSGTKPAPTGALACRGSSDFVAQSAQKPKSV